MSVHYIAGSLFVPGTRLTANVTGDCSHQHRTIEAARGCIADHDRRIKRGHGQHAYSDRRVIMVRDGMRVEIES